MFSMAVGTIGEWLKLVPFFLGDVQLIGGGADFLAVKHLIINVMAWVPRKKNSSSIVAPQKIGNKYSDST